VYVVEFGHHGGRHVQVFCVGCAADLARKLGGDDGQSRAKARVPAVGEVWRLETGRKGVVRQRHVDSEDLDIFQEFVCSRPHEDEDFSYMCGSGWCRCCS
jgi:hypothetical protein